MYNLYRKECHVKVLQGFSIRKVCMGLFDPRYHCSIDKTNIQDQVTNLLNNDICRDANTIHLHLTKKVELFFHLFLLGVTLMKRLHLHYISFNHIYQYLILLFIYF